MLIYKIFGANKKHIHIYTIYTILLIYRMLINVKCSNYVNYLNLHIFELYLNLYLNNVK